jgi:excinuclease ABC subunit B
MPPFRLQAPYAPAGDQPRAISQLVSGVQERGEQFQVLMGVTGSGKTFTMANVIQEVNRPTLILTHNKTLAAQLYQEFKDFFPDNAVEYFVSYYDYYQPEAYVVHSDTFIEKDASINDEIDKLRMRATVSLLTRKDVIVVASVSCIYGLGMPETFRDLTIRLEVGQELERDELLRDLVHIQYNRNDLSVVRGAFRVRGDVIEVHPAYDDYGIRIEMFGDEIENLCRFHLLTGEIIEELEEAFVAPAHHFVTKEENMDRVINDIQRELNAQIARFEEEEKLLEKQRITSRTRYDVEMLKETGHCSGIENYSRILENRPVGSRPSTLLDFFGEDWLFFIDESHVSIPQAGGMYEGDRSRKQTLVDYGFRLPCALDNRPMNFKEFEANYPPQVVYV